MRTVLGEVGLQVDLRGIAEAIKARIPDARVIVFGSRVRGDWLEESDVDIIVVSSVFEGMSFSDRASLVLRILWEERVLPRVDVDVLCYTPEEFERKRREIGVVSEALRYGVEF